MFSITNGTNPFLEHFKELQEVYQYVIENDTPEEERLSTAVSLILTKLEEDSLSDIEAVHRNISIASGRNIGLFTADYQYRSVVPNIRKLLRSSECTENPVRKNILEYLTSKDDSMILLVSLLFEGMSENKNIADKLKFQSGLRTSFQEKVNLDDIFSSNEEKREDNLTEEEVNKLLVACSEASSTKLNLEISERLVEVCF